MAARKLLIVGATGKQGGAVIKALLSRSAPFEILALTRNASSAGSQALASKPNIKLVEGNPSSPNSIFETHKDIYGVFSVTVPGKEGAEEAQAKPLIDAAIANGVSHFVFTSVDRGGDGRSEQNPTKVPHFSAKHRIEEYLKEKAPAGGSKMQWTILRPTCFIDNLNPGFFGKAFASMWVTVGDKPLQCISVHDIGVFAAKAFMDVDTYKGRAISLAGMELTFPQANEIFKNTMGYDLPQTFGFVGKGLQWAIGEVGTMFQWFRDEGYGANIEALKKEEPELQDLAKWLKESSNFPKK